MKTNRQQLTAILVLSGLLLSACSPVTEAPAPSSGKKVAKVTVVSPDEDAAVVAPADAPVVIEQKAKRTAVAARKTVTKPKASTRTAAPQVAAPVEAAAPAPVPEEETPSETIAEPVSTTVSNTVPDQTPAEVAAEGDTAVSSFFKILLTVTLIGLMFTAPFYAGPLHRKLTGVS